MFQNNNLSTIGSNLLFKGVDEAIIKKVFNAKNFHKEKEGTLIFQSGEESNYLYLIVQGEVKLKYAGTKGSNSSFRRGKNEYFGDQEVLEKTTRITSAVADTDCFFYRINRDELFFLMSLSEDIQKNLSFSAGDETNEVENFTEEYDSGNHDDFKIEDDQSESIFEKQNEELVIDESFTDYSNLDKIEELPDITEDNYLSYAESEEGDEDLNFNNNGFNPDEKPITDENSKEIPEDLLKEEEQDNIIYEENSEDNLITEESELVPIIDDFEHIPEEPQKFDFTENNTSKDSDNFSRNNQQTETDTLTLIESTSHFVRNNLAYPLDEIKRLSDLLSSNTSLPDASQVNELVKKQTDFIQSLINSSFYFVAQNTKLNLKRQTINQVLTGILDLIAGYAESRDVRLFKKIETDAEVEADESVLLNVFFQLAKNACDSMPEGGNIFVTTVKKENNIVIEFVDEGIGIPSSLTFEVFEPMVSHGKKDGTGLGLSIAKRIIQDHKGEISAEGELGEGTKILITLPSV